MLRGLVVQNLVLTVSDSFRRFHHFVASCGRIYTITDSDDGVAAIVRGLRCWLSAELWRDMKMAKNILEYKGYVAKVCYDAKRCVLYGKVDGIVDAVNFETADPTGVEQAFHEAVDHYLSFCDSVGRRPAKAYKGQFNVRIPPELHKAVSLWAAAHDMTMNAAVELAIERLVATSDEEY